MRSDKAPGDNETKTFLRLSLESVRQGSKLQYSMVSPANQSKGNQGTYDMQPLKPIDCQNSDSNRKNIAGIQFLPLHHRIPSRDEIISVESNYCCEGTSKNPLERTHMNVSEKDGTSAASKTSQGRFVNSPSYADPNLVDNVNFEFDKGKISAPTISRSFFISNHQLSSTDMEIQENKNLHDSRWPVNLGLEGRMDSCSQPKNAVAECYLENKTSMFFDPAPTSNNPLSKMSRESFLKIPKCSSFELFPGLIASEKTEVNSIQKGAKCNHNVESMRIYPTGDPVTDRRQWPTFCQTTQSLLITKKTDINLLNGGDIRGSTMANGNTTSNAYNCDRGKRKLKPQSSSRFITSDARRNFDRVKTSKVALKYESTTAETDPIDLYSFMKTNVECGANSTTMKKDISIGRNLSPKKVTAFLKLAGCRRPDIELPDINLELPTPPDTGTLSTAQSLDFNILMAFAEEPKNKSDINLDSPAITAPSNCWVKRLKLSSSNSARGTKSSDTDIYLSHEKMKKFSTEVLNSSATGSETTVMKAHDKGPILSDEGHLRKKEHCLLRNPTNEGKDVFLSHAWIQRWRRKGSCITDSDKLMSNVPKSANSALGDLHKKQFPSTAAMALMGRTIKGFRPCELQKRGSFIVWNTKVF